MKPNARKMWQQMRHYWKLSFAATGAIIGLALQLSGQSFWAHLLLAVPPLVLAVPMFASMIRELREGTYGVDILAITAIVTSVVMKEYWAGMVIALMLTGGEALEDFAENRAKREMTSLLSNTPRTAHVLRGKRELDVAAHTVKKGDKIVIRPGETVPVDAVIVRGEANFDEASITGESLPEEKLVGAELLSGSINLDGTVVARALRPASESQYEQIVKLVKGAAASKAPFVRLADRFAIPFTVISFVIAIAAWLLSHDPKRFLEVMVVATPCPLILAAPIAIISGMSRASKAGIIVKTGTALERIASAKSFAFDKTGTLTHGRLAVSKVEVLGKTRVDDVISAAAALSSGSNHVTSIAITSYAKTKKYSFEPATQIKEHAGKGMMGKVGGKSVMLGRASFIVEHGANVEQSVLGRAEQQTSSLLAIDGKAVAIIYYEDEVRNDAKSTLQYLRSQGIVDTYMITGDNEATAYQVAKEVGIPRRDVVARALPIDKLRTVERVAKPPVAYVGDGVNDAPVLVAADVGIALGAKGSTAASESADIVIMKDSFTKIADILRIARRTFYVARQSILVGIGLSVILMLVFSTGRFSPVVGAAVQEIVDVIVIFNALRAHVAGR